MVENSELAEAQRMMEKYAVVDSEQGIICHHDAGAAISETQDEAEYDLPIVADMMGWDESRLKVMKLVCVDPDVEVN